LRYSLFRSLWNRRVDIYKCGIKLKTDNNEKFTEKKIKKTKKGDSVSYSPEEKTIIIVIVIALVIMGALLIRRISEPIETEQFSVIYYLDSEKHTENIPKIVVLGENSTFPLWVGVENHYETTRTYNVSIKIDTENSPINPSPLNPTETFENTLNPGEKWEFPVTITIEQMGRNNIIFDLYYLDGADREYTGNWVNLSIEAT
jgi:uncharacterized membrane protein